MVHYIIGCMLLLSSCERSKQTGKAQGGDSPMPTIRVGFRPSVIVDLAFLKAYSENLFEESGLPVKLVPYGRPDLMATAAGNGEIDAALGMPLETFLAASEDQPLGRGYLWWYFSQDVAYDALVVPADSRIQAGDELPGLRVGSHPSKQVTYFVGLMAGSAQAVKPYNPAAPFLSLRSREVDAIYVLEPFVTDAASDPGFKIIETSSISKRLFDGEKVPAALSVVTSKFLNEQPELAAKFVDLALSAYRDMPADPDWRAAVLGKKEFGGWDEKRAREVKEPASSTPDQLDPASFARFCEKLKNGGLLDRDVDLDSIIYRSGDQ